MQSRRENPEKSHELIPDVVGSGKYAADPFNLERGQEMGPKVEHSPSSCSAAVAKRFFFARVFLAASANVMMKWVICTTSSQRTPARRVGRC